MAEYKGGPYTSEDGPEEAENPSDLAKHWVSEITAAEKELGDFFTRSKRILKRYRLEESLGSGNEEGDKFTSYNMFWSIIQILAPAVYSSPAKPQVSRRFKDKDSLGRTAAQLLERSLAFSADDSSYHPAIAKASLDNLIVGRGQAWVRYVPTFVEMEDPETGEMYEDVGYEEVVFDHVLWKDFLTSPARNWDEVRWVSRIIYLTKKEFKDRFPNIPVEEIPLDFVPDGMDEDANNSPENDILKRARVYEIWDKTTKKVYWISKSYTSQPLDEVEDPLSLRGFFPCPKPLDATRTTESMIPIADYRYYQDQLKELDEITTRISLLTDALKVAGTYDSKCTSVARLLTEGAENNLYPEDNWALMSQQGGLAGVVSFLPMDQIVNVLGHLYNARDRIIQIINEISGVSDVLRGTPAPYETAATQSSRVQFGTLRLSEKQREVQRFAKDLLAIAGEIISEQFSEESIALMSGVTQLSEIDPNVMNQFGEAVALLRNDTMRTYRVDIETDSTLAADENIDKQRRAEYLTSMGQFLSQSVQAAQAFPELTPIFAEMILFGSKGFRIGRSLETQLETTIENTKRALEESRNQPQPPPPELMKLQVEQQMKQAELALKKEDQDLDRQLETLRVQLELRKIQLEEFKAKQDAITDSWKVQLESEKIDTNAAVQLANLEASRNKMNVDAMQAQIQAMVGASREEPSINVNVDAKPGTRITRLKTDPLTNEKIAITEELPGSSI